MDALNIWRAGNAVFMRNWTAAYLLSGAKESGVKNNFVWPFHQWANGYGDKCVGWREFEHLS